MSFRKVACVFCVLLCLVCFSSVAFADDVSSSSVSSSVLEPTPEPTPVPSSGPSSEPVSEEEELGSNMQQITDGVLGSFVESLGGMGTAIMDFVSNFLGGINFAGFLAASLIWIPSFYWRIFLMGIALGFVTLVISFLK